MIKTKKDLKKYLSADKYSLGRKKKRPNVFDYIWKYEIFLRRCEYHYNNKGIIHRLLFLYNYFFYRYLGAFCGFTIPLNVCDMGLSIAHIGTVVINKYAKIGKNCRIHVGVNIGTQFGYDDKAPSIGDNFFISPGVKMFGDITIGNNIVIGANSVVNKSFFENNICIAGCPAKIINNNGRLRTERDINQVKDFEKYFLD